MEILRFGSRGADVELLQLALTRAGRSPGAIDGVFGNLTHSALIAYQRVNGLAPDGIAGPLAWGSLLKFIMGFTVRQIARGDTFWALAGAFGTTVRAIETANPDADPYNLRPGQTLIIPYGFPLVPTNIRYTSHLSDYIMTGLIVRYPFIRSSIIGRSAMNKPLTALSIGRGPARVFYNATHHANEWITTPVLLKYLEDYALALTSGGRIWETPAAFLYNDTTLFAVPLVNPDGIDLVNGVLNRGPHFEAALRFARNYPYIPFPEGWKANIRGVDLNLQYPAAWEDARDIKYAQGFTRPGPRDFVGLSPLSEPESRAVYDFTLSRDFRLILAYHTQGKIIYWKFRDFNPPRSYEIARKMGEASGYTVEETPLASGAAGYKDWFIQDFNRPGYTIECGAGINPLPLSQFDEIYRDNLGILTLGLLES